MIGTIASKNMIAITKIYGFEVYMLVKEWKVVRGQITLQLIIV